MVNRSMLTVLTSLCILGCAHSAPTDQRVLIENPTWSVRIPSHGWWTMGVQDGTIGGSRYNVGTRPINFTVRTKCYLPTDEIPPFDAGIDESKVLGRGFTYFGSVPGFSVAAISSDPGEGVVYLAGAWLGGCRTSFRCFGDPLSIEHVEAECDGILRTLRLDPPVPKKEKSIPFHTTDVLNE